MFFKRSYSAAIFSNVSPPYSKCFLYNGASSHKCSIFRTREQATYIKPCALYLDAGTSVTPYSAVNPCTECIVHACASTSGNCSLVTASVSSNVSGTIGTTFGIPGQHV